MTRAVSLYEYLTMIIPLRYLQELLQDFGVERLQQVIYQLWHAPAVNVVYAVDLTIAGLVA